MMNLVYRCWRPLCVIQFGGLLLIYTYLSLSSSPGDYVPTYNDKLMHFSGYLVAALSITFALPGMPWWQRWLILAIYSTGIEIAQHFMPPRTFSMLDILANLSGALVGLAVMGIARRLAPGWSRALLND